LYILISKFLDKSSRLLKQIASHRGTLIPSAIPLRETQTTAYPVVHSSSGLNFAHAYISNVGN
jgi:hypothetical protein